MSKKRIDKKQQAQDAKTLAELIYDIYKDKKHKENAKIIKDLSRPSYFRHTAKIGF